jgi:DNA-directed RNA polymerase
LGSRFVLSDTRQDVPEPPEPGELDLREVLRSTYFFS